MSTILDQQDRQVLQSFLANVVDERTRPLGEPQNNWVHIESLLSEAHRVALFGDARTGIKAESSGATAICYRLSDGSQRVASRGTLVPPDARIEYIKKSVAPKPDNDEKPLHIPSVGGG